MIPIALPLVGAEEAKAAADAVLSGWLSQGREVAGFEAEFAAITGAPHACAVSNCTTALHLALLAAGVGPGGEVVTVSSSFIATANTVRQCGATPVFVDVEPGGLNMDPARIEAALTPRTRAILCVHQLGMPCDLAGIVPVARRYGLALIEDAACALGSQIRWDGAWQPVGGPVGDIACFSFHPRKVVTTGEGGMLTTCNPDWDRRFRLWRQHGMSVPDLARHGSAQVLFETYDEPGYNYRMTDIQAAIGRSQLRRLPGMVAARRALAARYTLLLQDVPGVRPPSEPAWARSNWQSYCIRLPSGAYQRRVMQAMLDAGVATRRGVMCAHLEPAYAGRNLAPLPHSEAARDRHLILPLFPQMTDAMQDEVVAALQAALSPRVRRPRVRRGNAAAATAAVPAASLG